MKNNDKEEDFKIVKEKNDRKGNYIFQKDGITKTGFFIIAIVLIILIALTIYYGLQVTE